MKKLSIVLAGAAIALGFAVISIPGFAQNGNGITSNGPHFNLNIIGVTDSKNPPLTNSDRHTIFVPLNTAQDDPVPGADIWLTQGPFAVCDGNAFDAAHDCNGTQIAKLGAVFHQFMGTPRVRQRQAAIDDWANRAALNELHSREQLCFRSHHRAENRQVAIEHMADVSARIEPARSATGNQSTAVSKRRNRAGPGRRACMLENDVDASPIGQSLDLSRPIVA